MLEQLFNLVKWESESDIINNPAIPNEQNNHAVGMAADSIFGGLQNALGQGGLKDVLGMFTGGVSSNHPMISGIIINFSGGLVNKFGLDESAAGSIAGRVIPNVMDKLIHKTNDPNDQTFNINGVIGSLTGHATQQGGGVQIPGSSEDGSGIDFGGILQNLGGGGLEANHDGQVGLDDLSGLVSGMMGRKETSEHEGQQDGGVMGMLKGLMGS